MKTAKFLIRKDPVYQRCPSCNKPNTLHRSRARKTKERVINAITFCKLYRCHSCGWRGYLSKFKITYASIRNLFIYIIIAALSAYLVMTFIKRFTMN